MELRELKALEIAARAKIAHKDGIWTVPSQSGKGHYRVVIWASPSCTCDDFQLTQKPCKHIIAARIVCERDGGKPAEVVVDTVPKKPTYTQDWPRYNLAQQTEKHRFQEILADLCRGVEEFPQPKTGRRRVPTADLVFASALKVYTTFSSRRFACDLKDAHQRGHLSHLMNSMSVCYYLDNPALFPILTGLIEKSALPLAPVETNFAVDSSGFSSSRFERWYDEKYGRDRSACAWVKAHICCGVKTNAITAVRILDRDAGDCPQFTPLVNTTAQGFKINEVSGDKAYSSVETLGTVAAHGGTAFIPFKSSATGGVGGLFEQMFHYFQFRREDFLQHYHQRSNVESTFAMVKAKFRDHVRSKTDTAMKNEVLCKFLCHNICCLIHAACELGIEPVFWKGGLAETPTVLPFRQPG
jgi:transposase